MNYWKGLGKFLWKVVAGVGVILGFFQWGIKLKVSTWVIPSWVLLLLIAATLAVAGYTAYFVSKYPNIGAARKQKKVKINLNEEEAFVLAALSLHKERHVTREALRRLFMEKLKGKNDADFNIVLNKLQQLGLIDFTHDFLSNELVAIMPKGLEHCEKLRDASKK